MPTAGASVLCTVALRGKQVVASVYLCRQTCSLALPVQLFWPSSHLSLDNPTGESLMRDYGLLAAQKYVSVHRVLNYISLRPSQGTVAPLSKVSGL